MAIRKNTNPQQMDLQPEMRDLLMRNGMQAHVVSNGSGYQLVVQGHDSPLLTYNITEKQMLALTDWGTNHANKLAYNTFTGIVGNDFYMPKNFVHARNANGRVAMGLHGYRVGIGEYGRMGRIDMPPPFLGWTPRSQEGFHLRRVGGRLFFPEAPIVPERWDGRMKPGELQSGGYGFYYKGQQQSYSPQQQDVLKDLEGIIMPSISRTRSTEPAKPYKELITSPVYFTNEKWQECLSSHGIVIDAEKKTLTIQSTATQQDFVYDLSDEELSKLTDNSLKSTPMQDRLDVMNHVISSDFQEQITKDMLNSKEQIAISLKPEVEASMRQRMEEDQPLVVSDPLNERQHVAPTLDPNQGYTDGQTVDESKGWYREGKHGREVEVGDIWVEKAPVQPKEGDKPKKDDEQKFTYKMSAVINGEVITHEICKKQYDKFLAVDDYQRQRMMSKIFKEVDMKSRPEMRERFNLGAFLGAGLYATREATMLGADIAHNIEHIKHPHGPAPEIHQEVHGTARIYVKPGVDSPQDIAARAFDAGLNAGSHNHGMGHGR